MPDTAKARSTRQYQHSTTIESLEDEVRALETERALALGQDDPHAPGAGEHEDSPDPKKPLLPPSDDAWEKRYGNLRRHSQEREQAFKNRIAELERSMTDATQAGMQLPTTEEELDQWIQEYPEQTKVIQSLAMRVAAETEDRMAERLKYIETREAEANRDIAAKKLMAAHPDFEDLRVDPAFHEWLQDQPRMVQSALMENDTDWQSAARALDLYKRDAGITADPKRPAASRSDNSAAMSVKAKSNRTSPTGDARGRVFKESEIMKMRPQEFERLEAEIEKARHEGRFIFDLQRK